MNNFTQRAITGVFFVATVIGLSLWSAYSFMALLIIIAGVAMWEFYALLGIQSMVQKLIGIGLGLAMITSKYWFDSALLWLPLSFPLMAISVLFSQQRSFKTLAILAAAILYIALPMSLMHYAVFSISGHYQALYAINLFTLIWCSDTFAYLSGKLLGKHKLFPSVSPGKTWEGVVGGMLLTGLAAYGLGILWQIPVQFNVVIGVLTVVFGTLGDLVESMLKREVQVKDSGSILPGHGGMLDRFDALLLSLPFTTACYWWMMYH